MRIIRTQSFWMDGFCLEKAHPLCFISEKVKYPVENVTIDLMTWINDFTKYLGIGNILVLELLEPDETIFSKKIAERYI